MKTMYIVWANHVRRAEIIGNHLDADVRFVACGQRDKLWQTPFRYGRQLAETWKILRDERPDVVLVQNPPIFLAFSVLLYAQRYGAQFVLDSHTAAFHSPKWRWSLGLHRMLSQHALTTLVHNEDLDRIVRQWGCHRLNLGFFPEEYPNAQPFPVQGRFNVAVISTGAEDEPIDVVFDAARHLSDVTFYVTGSAERLPAETRANRPDNCHLTGFLPTEEYVGLIDSVDAVLDLTTRDHTILSGGFEAVSLGTPFITSDWPILRSYFSQGTVHVDNTIEGVCSGVCHTRANLDALQQGILRQREMLMADWERNIAELRHLITAQPAPSQTPARA